MNKNKVDNKKESKKISKNQTRFSPISDDSLNTFAIVCTVEN